MKLYTFIPTNYSSAYFVVANSPEDAVANVISFLKGKAEKEIVTHPPHGYHYAPDYREWINATATIYQLGVGGWFLTMYNGTPK